MKRIICIGILAACLEMASALQCYICLTPTPSDQCLVKKNCTQHQSRCESTVYGPMSDGFPFTDSNYVVRNCAEKCKSTSPNLLGVTRPVYCCKEDLCNIKNGAETAKHAASSCYTVTAAVCSIITALRVTS